MGRVETRMPRVLGERVRSALRSLYSDQFGSNGAALAAALGVSGATVSQQLSGEHAPSMPLAKKIAALQGVEVDVLLGIGESNLGRSELTKAQAENVRWFLRELSERPPKRSASELARKLGIAPSVILEILNERAMPDMATATKIAKMLKLPAGSILDPDMGAVEKAQTSYEYVTTAASYRHWGPSSDSGNPGARSVGRVETPAGGGWTLASTAAADGLVFYTWRRITLSPQEQTE
jgi:transcriptional regulator with XRE-family HTH domain